VLAESNQRVSQEARSAEAQIPWRAIAGFRNIVVHDYLGLDMEAIWNVVEKELPPLRSALASKVGAPEFPSRSRANWGPGVCQEYPSFCVLRRPPCSHRAVSGSIELVSSEKRSA
jgi:hypothetical protein